MPRSKYWGLPGTNTQDRVVSPIKMHLSLDPLSLRERQIFAPCKICISAIHDGQAGMRGLKTGLPIPSPLIPLDSDSRLRSTSHVPVVVPEGEGNRWAPARSLRLSTSTYFEYGS